MEGHSDPPQPPFIPTSPSFPPNHQWPPPCPPARPTSSSSTYPQLAEEDKILATPTLAKILPPPVRRIIGDLSDRERVLIGLDLLYDELTDESFELEPQAAVPHDPEPLDGTAADEEPAGPDPV